ncbi:MAG: hypothetical protein OEV49_07355 [candidate division Zixibacteria bacterium]|nr:hypothetical protein [candidate division Zixibacteria bacterium]MDH3938466.1 hypothetical protein [candidate division Zixibacteria bacterium]MDH4033218.1 hypothetical protein [candidate division Zixibacteria bacterium]
MRKTLLVTSLLSVFLTASTSAAVPTAINYQGLLLDNAGEPVADAAYSVVFTIYDAAAAGNSKWTETQNVNTSGGLFSVLLGSINPILDTVFNGSTRYLGIKVGVDPEISPRTAMVTVPYSFRTATVDGASGGNITSKVTIGPGHTNSGADAFVAGDGNIASGDQSTVGGGTGHDASGTQSTIAGGRSSTVSATVGTVGGGIGNTASGTLASTVAGGESNTASASRATVGGGSTNEATGERSTISGGSHNDASGEASTVGGGRNNYARGDFSTIAGGGSDVPADSNYAEGIYSTVGGGAGNGATSGRTTVGGGRDNIASGYTATIAGGYNNSASDQYSSVGGGSGNIASGFMATIAGGQNNEADGTEAAIGGGNGNTADGSRAAIPGGQNNEASGAYSLLAGLSNTTHAEADYSMAVGRDNIAGRPYAVALGNFCLSFGESSFAVGDHSQTFIGANYSVAMGRNAFAEQAGTFVFADSTDALFDSHAPNVFIVRAAGGVGLGTDNPNGKALAIDNEFTGSGNVMLDLNASVDITSSGRDVLQIEVGGSATTIQYIECERGSDIEFRVHGDGDVTADGAFTGGGADFAELIHVSSGAHSVEAGDVMVIDPNSPRSIVMSTQPRSTLVAGIFSTSPGYMASEHDWDAIELARSGKSGNEADDTDLEYTPVLELAAEMDEVPLAVVGIVPCKVSAENGPIQVGDLLVTSSTPGHSMRDEDPKTGTVVGKALESLSAGTGIIKVLVSLN